MTQRVVYFNGRFVAESEAKVSIYDSAVAYGDMAFEVTRTIRQKPFRLDEHLQRLWRTLEAIHTEPGMDMAALEAITLETLAKNLPTEDADVDWQITHNISRGPLPMYRDAFAEEELRPTVIVSCYPLIEKLGRLADAYDTGLDLVVPPQPAIPGELLDPRLKTRSRLHYQLANLQAQEIRKGASAVLKGLDGYLTEGTSGNLFIVRDGALLTPAVNLLPGVTRALVLDLAERLGIEAEETDVSYSDAQAADEMFLTSTSIGILHARTFEGRLVSNGQIGPLTGRLRQTLFDDLGLDLAAQARSYAKRLDGS